MQRARLGRPSRYLNMSVKSTENDLETFEKKFSLKKMRVRSSLGQAQNRVKIFSQNLIF
eukprot:UN05661